MSRFIQPTREQLNAFREGDPIAIDEVISVVLPEVTRWAITTYDGVPPQEIASLVNQVFAEISANHSRYDPERALFTTYAINLIRLRIVDVQQRESSLMLFEGLTLEFHENEAVGTYNDIEEQIDMKRLFELTSARLDALEREFLQLMRDGENRAEVFERVLRRYQPVEHAEREINTIKERIRRRLKVTAREMKGNQDDD